MTIEEYTKLLEKSISFKALDEATRATILAARGEEMEKYIKIFQEEQSLLTRAVDNFYEQSEQVMVQFQGDVRKEKQKKLQDKEGEEHQQDEQQLSKLIQNL
jgi:t-SNARE complex subunit (syntaxin)